MTKETDYLIQSMFEGESLEEMPLDELRTLTEKYPYSSVVNFLYTCKLKSIYHIDFPEAVTKTAIFFNDPYWLNFQLSEDTEMGNIKKSGYEYNIQERNEEAKPQLSDNSEHQSTWQDEDGYEYSEENEELDTVKTGKDQSNVETFNFPQFKATETISGENFDQLIPIEPYHTVDYFASQGIKLSQSFEKDELGTKVKSFTDWLRTMKKLQPDAPEIRSTESLFPQLSKQENQQPTHEIITEAMAEVYLKQGLREKAIEVYNKLSLQNPANKHIFAAKLSLIKENNL
ncbi:MAG: hypothetical protein RLZZ172_2019 [Bacteroidota bacterium]|jgi:hypothetical protein